MPETQEQINARMAKVREGLKKKPDAPEGASVDLGDSAKGLYRDRAGGKLGGGPTEGQSYAAEVAKQAEISVREHLEREAQAEKLKGAE